ncbi:MAG TPA: phosphopentomutase [Capillimicrobium sp.]|nr:phosphopentomutase [Capillimicrobium sp.]
MGRAAVVVIDACGAGALPDAADYGDAGTNTLAHLADAVGGLNLPTLGDLGLGSIVPIAGVPPAAEPVVHGRLAAIGWGKDSTAGHWGLMGVGLDAPPPTYPAGFPPELVARLEAVTGHRFACNAPANGVQVLRDFGEHHLRTGELILYTSQDSVLQIAAHVDRVAPEELYAICGAVREVVDVGRVIARPFDGEPGAFVRTLGRRDFALAPPSRSYLDALRDAGMPVHAVGKVHDLFAGRGIDEAHPGATNATALAVTGELLRELDEGFVFTNLIETDQVYGHRKDVVGYHRALRLIDAAVAEWLALLRPGDLLVLTADHGCDPAAPHTDHTREYAPLLAIAAGRPAGGRHDGTLADVGATVLRHLTGRDDPGLPGRSFLP